MKYLVSKKGRWLYYLLNWTWGILPNFVALFIILFNIVFKHKRLHRHILGYYMEIGKRNWGGLNMGMFSFISPYAGLHTKNHEEGHGIQGIIFGPLMIPLIQIPSIIRYHYRNYVLNKGKELTTDYDDIWFEGQASSIGWKAFEVYTELTEDK